MNKLVLRQSLILFLTAVIWGVAFVAQSVGMDYVGPFTFSAVRNVIGGLVLLPCIGLLNKLNGKETHQEDKEDKRTLLIGGICCGILLCIACNLQQFGIMYTTSEVNSASTLAEYKEKAADYGFEIVESGVSSTADIPLAADSLLEQVDCLNNLTDNTVVASLPLILSKANAKNIPVFGSEIEQVKIGCLAAMGLDYVDLGKQTGRMAAEVLKGEKKASELNFEVIETAAFYGNSKVAEDLGITFPEDLASNAKELFTEITQ